MSVYFIIQNNFRADYEIIRTQYQGLETYYIQLNSNVTFLNKVKLRKALDDVPEYSVLTIDGSTCNFIDYDILEIVSEYHTKAHNRHIQLNVKGVEKVDVGGIH